MLFLNMLFLMRINTRNETGLEPSPTWIQSRTIQVSTQNEKFITHRLIKKKKRRRNTV